MSACMEGAHFPSFESFQIHQHPLFQLFISEAFPKSGTFERWADNLAGIIRDRIYNTGIWCTVVFSPDLFCLDVERGKQRIVFPEGWKR